MERNLRIALVVLLGLPACQNAPTPPLPGSDGGDAQRLVALLDYVGGDYRLAVRDGVVQRASEYEEQLRFVSDAERMAHQLLGAQPAAGDPLLGLIGELATEVRGKAAPEAVAAASKAAREEVVAHFHLATMPTERPALAHAEALFAQSCAKCHGQTGSADTEQAQQLDPKPASFRDPQRLIDLSPYRVYNALTFGVPGTAMASFGDALSPDERWSLAFYVFRLGHAGRAERGPVAISLADLAARSDREVLATLQAEGFPDPQQGLIYARRETAFREPPAGVGIDRTRRMLRTATEAAVAGRREDADRLVLDAYLQGFEPLEARLRVRDPDATARVEKGIHDLRTAFLGADADAMREHARDLDAQLARLGGSRTALPFLAAALIFFREGIEAALLVGALLAGLRRLGQPSANRYVHAGWLAALPAGVLTWWLFERFLSVSANQRELLEAVVALVAAAVLFSMSFWMISKVEARRWTDYLRRHLERSLGQRSLALLFGISFLAVYREAAEAVLFVEALLLEAGPQRAQVLGGALVGIVAVFAVAALMSRTVGRLPLGPFFAVSSLLLCLLAIAFAGAGVYQLVAGGYLPPRPVAFPEVRWLGIYPDLTGLLVQLAIVVLVLGAAVQTFRRRDPAPGLVTPPDVR